MIDLKSKKAIIGLFLAVPLLWLLTWLTLSIALEPEDRGQFGDMFGSINALFSGWAFVGVIIAILMQKEELELQREELRETRKEFQEQNITLKQQRFENTFFNMLSLHNEIVNASKANPEGNRTDSEGREVIHEIYEFLRKSWDRNVQTNIKIKTETLVKDTLNKHFPNVLNHYFRNLYRIFVFIKKNEDVVDSEFYSKILRAQLSDPELLLLFYNTHYYHKGKNFQKYTKLYKLFDNLPPEKLIHEEHLKLLNNFYQEAES